MRAAPAQLRRVAYASSVACFVIGAGLAAFRSAGSGVVASALGGVALAVAVWRDLALHTSAHRADVRRAQAAASAIDALRASLDALGGRFETVLHDEVGATVISLQEQTRALQASMDAAKGVSARLDRGVDVLQKHMVDFRSNQFERRHTEVLRRFDRVDTRVDESPGLSVEMARLAERIQPGSAALPLTGGWALSAATLVALVDEVLRADDIATVVECGSGASTVWTAAACRVRGVGHVYSLEHDDYFAEETRRRLRQHGLDAWATVIDAPLVDIDVEGRTVLWFDLAGAGQLPRRIDLLLVDGPPGSSSPQARWPAYPVLRSRLRIGSRVVLDDTDRDQEQQIAASWLARSDSDGGLVQRAVVGRSTFYEVRSVSDVSHIPTSVGPPA